MVRVWCYRSHVVISQELTQPSQTHFFPVTTFVAILNGGVTAVAFVSPGDLSLGQQLAQVAPTSAMGLDQDTKS